VIDPTGQDLKRFLAEDPGGPVVMLNLLRFRPDGGKERYDDYLAHFRAASHRHGAEVVYWGEGATVLVAEDGQAWDAVLVVRYPGRQAFSDMVRDPAYSAGAHLRSEALVEAVLQATSPVGTGTTPEQAA